MEQFHLAEREPVALAIEAAARCDTLEELHAAIEAYRGHEVAVREGYTPSWPITKPTHHPDGPLVIISEKPEPSDKGKAHAYQGMEYGWAMREALEWCGVDIDQIHVAYACHWAPDHEKAPNATHLSASRPFLFRELEIVKPRAILAPGRTVMDSLFMYRGPLTPMLEMTMDWKRGDLRIPAYICNHPAWPARFKTQMVAYREQIGGFFERFGMPDGSPFKTAAHQKAA